MVVTGSSFLSDKNSERLSVALASRTDAEAFYFSLFSNSYSNYMIQLHQQCDTVPDGDTQTPIRLFMQLRQANPNALLLESAEVDGRWGRYSVIATDFLAEFSCRGGRLAVQTHSPELELLKACDGMPYIAGMRAATAMLNLVQDKPGLPPITRALYGYWGYEMVAVFQPKMAETIDPASAECRLVLPATIALFDHLYNRLYHLSIGTPRRLDCLPPLRDTHPTPCRTGEVSYRPSAEAYCRCVEKVRTMLHEGEAIQVVGASQCSTEFEGDAFTLYRRLRRLNPSPYMFCMAFDNLELLGASPEVMVRCTDNRLLLSPIAGTRRRGRDEEEDLALAAEMTASPKERAEHVMLVDLGRNDLGRVAQGGSVKVERLMDVERFSHVMHMTSRISADLSPECDGWDLLASTFPAGTVSGAPKVRAMQIIHEIEEVPRGPYAGCIGWFGLDKDAVHLDTGITIRSLWKRDGRLYWQTGAGLVYDSVPEQEWLECRNKGRIVDAILAEDHI